MQQWEILNYAMKTIDKALEDARKYEQVRRACLAELVELNTKKCSVCLGIGEVKDFYGEWIICPQCWRRNKWEHT